MLVGGQDLVGRRQELACLEQALTVVRAGSPRLMWVHGPAGVGKSALIGAFLETMPVSHVLRAVADPLERQAPFALLRQALLRPPAGLEGRARRLVRSLGKQPSVTAAATLLVAFLEAASETWVLVMDDLHWADSASMDTLARAFAHTNACQLLVIAVGRSGRGYEAPVAWRRFVEGEEHVWQLSVEGLERGALAELAARRGRPLSPAAARRLTQHVAGNARDAIELIDEVQTRVLSRGWGFLPAPASVRSRVGSQMAAISEPAQALVDAVAVLGSPASTILAARVAAITEYDAALEEAVAAGLLAEVLGAPTPGLAFEEPLAQVGVYQALTPRVRRCLHSRAAEFTDGEVRLRHQVGAVGPGREERAALAEQLEETACSRLASGSFQSAANDFDLALEVALDRVSRQRLLLASADAYLRSGDVLAAEARLAELEQSGPCRVPGELLGALHLASGHSGQAEVCLGSVALPDEEGQVAQVVQGPLYTLAVSQGKGFMPAPQVWGSTVESTYAASVALGLAGRTGEALVAVEVAIRDGTAGSGLLLARGLLRCWSDDLPGAHADLARVVACSSPATEYFNPGHYALTLLADVEYRSGNWSAAITHARSCVSEASDSGRPWHACVAHAIAALPLLQRGDIEAAQAHLRAAEELATAAPVELVTSCVARAEAALAGVRGDAAGALVALDRAERACDPAEPAFFGDGAARALTLIALGRPEQAEEAIATLRARAQALSRRSALAQAFRATGCLASLRGCHDEAVAHLEVGLAYFDSLAMPFEEARVRFDLAQSLANLGRVGEALNQVEAAGAAAAGLSARGLLKACAQLTHDLRRLHKSPPRELLTPAEVEVVRLALNGLSNVDIARQRVVSVKTVETQLTRVYAKLALPNRMELAIYFRDRPLMPGRPLR